MQERSGYIDNLRASFLVDDAVDSCLLTKHSPPRLSCIILSCCSMSSSFLFIVSFMATHEWRRIHASLLCSLKSISDSFRSILCTCFPWSQRSQDESVKGDTALSTESIEGISRASLAKDERKEVQNKSRLSRETCFQRYNCRSRRSLSLTVKSVMQIVAHSRVSFLLCIL